MLITAISKCFLHVKQLQIQSINSLHKRIDSFFLANNADAVIDAGTDKVILLHHTAGKDAGFDLFAFSFADSKTYSCMLLSAALKLVIDLVLTPFTISFEGLRILKIRILIPIFTNLKFP